jgi:hypothetical protein
MQRSILLAGLIGIFCTIGLFVLNFAAMGISPDHYRKVVEDAAADGSFLRTLHLPLAPSKDIVPYDGNDCLILEMLSLPRESRVKASISPRFAALTNPGLPGAVPGYVTLPHCQMLAAVMDPRRPGPIPLTYYHRYLHGDLTVAALLLAVLQFATAGKLLLLACYGALAALAATALVRMRGASIRQRRRAAAFVVITIVLAAFYELPQFGGSFSFAPTDLVIAGFLLFGLVRPVCRLSERSFVIASATFGAAIAIFEFLTGGIPIALATLITMVALGEAPDGETLVRRLWLGVLSFSVAVVACFACKVVVVAMIWGPHEIADAVLTLNDRLVGPVAARVPAELAAVMVRLGLEVSSIDTNVMVRVLLVGVMLTYSAFILGLGSHVLGAALVLVPLPALAVLTYRALRQVRPAQWIEQPQALLLLAGLVPVIWYLAFTNHTFTHSYMMVRPMALDIALALIAVSMGRGEGGQAPPVSVDPAQASV